MRINTNTAKRLKLCVKHWIGQRANHKEEVPSGIAASVRSLLSQGASKNAVAAATGLSHHLVTKIEKSKSGRAPSRDWKRRKAVDARGIGDNVVAEIHGAGMILKIPIRSDSPELFAASVAELARALFK